MAVAVDPRLGVHPLGSRVASREVDVGISGAQGPARVRARVGRASPILSRPFRGLQVPILLLEHREALVEQLSTRLIDAVIVLALIGSLRADALET